VADHTPRFMLTRLDIRDPRFRAQRTLWSSQIRAEIYEIIGATTQSIMTTKALMAEVAYSLKDRPPPLAASQFAYCGARFFAASNLCAGTFSVKRRRLHKPGPGGNSGRVGRPRYIYDSMRDARFTFPGSALNGRSDVRSAGCNLSLRSRSPGRSHASP
jgi:hypothetical protein